MIIARAPFRISFAGGGSDVPGFYEKDYGAVVSSAINKYMYIIIHPYFHDKIRIKYSQVEDVDKISDIHHPLVRECLNKIGINSGIEIASIADVPARTGLGSSSAFTVGLLNALSAYKGKFLAKEELASQACDIEINILKEPIGKQDQYASSLGGLNYLRFNSDGTVYVKRLVVPGETIRELEQNLLLFYVGGERDARDILKRQNKDLTDPKKAKILHEMVKLSEQLKDSLEKGEISNFGKIINEGWLLKKSLSEKISNERVDRYYALALASGAEGGKLLGAGAAGFLLLYCKKEFQDKIRKKLDLKELEFNFDQEGTKIIYGESL